MQKEPIHINTLGLPPYAIHLEIFTKHHPSKNHKENKQCGVDISPYSWEQPNYKLLVVSYVKIKILL
uniref:Uncharacterized protein n=1 Tax=Anguilla anguilla TaxID=7936 RepID=A0A0E9XTJ8_ANGAN